MRVTWRVSAPNARRIRAPASGGSRYTQSPGTCRKPRPESPDRRTRRAAASSNGVPPTPRQAHPPSFARTTEVDPDRLPKPYVEAHLPARADRPRPEHQMHHPGRVLLIGQIHHGRAIFQRPVWKYSSEAMPTTVIQPGRQAWRCHGLSECERIELQTLFQPDLRQASNGARAFHRLLRRPALRRNAGVNQVASPQKRDAHGCEIVEARRRRYNWHWDRSSRKARWSAFDSEG